MSEMTERVVKAIRQKAAEIDHRPGVLEADPMWFADEYARAAIEAMREPTEGMIKAAGVVSFGTDNRPYIIRDWNAMIDAALKEI